MDDYIRGALQDLEARVRFLKNRVRPKHGRSNATLVKICRDKLDAAAVLLGALRTEPDWQTPEAAGPRFRTFRDLVRELDELEYIAVQILDRWSDDDARANALLDRVATEIQYPLPAPVLACQSREYYRLYPDLGLLLIPPAEGAFLLHLPDLCHELGHPLLTEFNDAKLDPLQKIFMRLWAASQTYVHNELERESRRRTGPQSMRFYLEGWRKSWRSWLTEMICDVFATHTLGPAFGWGHLHLSAKRGGDPFQVPLGGHTTHPADNARFHCILHVLNRNGWGAHALSLQEKWRGLLSLGGYNPSPEYARCFPDELLDVIAALAADAVQSTNCSMATPEALQPVAATLNEAWAQFWRDPDTYADWQQNAVISFGLSLE